MDIIKFWNKYCIKSNRLKWYDYSLGWAYFITICTKYREDCFWEIVSGQSVLNDIGNVVKNEILNIPKFRKNVELDEFIIMPNHIHLILFLFDGRDVSLKHLNETDIKNENQIFTAQYFSEISPKKWTVGNIVKLFKWYSKKKINALYSSDFVWQSNFYDHIIRNEKELYKIRQYIINNPLKYEIEKNII